MMLRSAPAGLLLSTLLTVTLPAGAQELERLPDSTLDYVYLQPDVRFAAYDAVLIDPISVWFPEADRPATDAARATARDNLAQAQRRFRAAVEDALGDAYPIVDAAAPGVLRLHVEFADLRSVTRDEDIPEQFLRYRFRVAPGHITIVGDITDAASGRLLGRAADLGEERSFGSSTAVDWETVEADFRRWAGIFRRWLDEEHAATAPSS